MNTILADLRLPAVISSLLVLPLMILEWVNRRGFHEGFPVVLFAFLWLLTAALILILAPIVRSARAGNGLTTNPVSLLLRVALLTCIVILWVGVVVDQMPCFLGVANCD